MKLFRQVCDGIEKEMSNRHPLYDRVATHTENGEPAYVESPIRNLGHLLNSNLSMHNTP
jgi:hypothetical protein